jgi:TP901 family phage tail tape measure protein
MASLKDSRKAMITIGLDPRPLEKGIDDARKKLTGLGTLKKIMLGGAATAVGNLISGGLGAISGGLADAATETLNFERNLTRLQIAGGRSAGQMAGLREKISKVSRATSVGRSDLLAGAAAYVRMTGDLTGAEEALDTFGKVSIATGASMDDIASTAAALRQNLKIDPKEFKGAFDVLITQGKAGAIELNELATLMAGVAPTFAKFKGGTGLSGMAELGAAMQVGRQAFGSASETVTGLRAFATAVTRNASKFKKGTVFYTDEKGVKRMRSFRDIVDSIGKSDLAKDPEKLQKAFGSDEAQRFFDVISKNRGDLDKLTKEALGSDATNKDAAEYLASPAGKLETAYNALKVSVAEAFSPDLVVGFVNAVAQLAAGLSHAVGFIQYLRDGMVEWERKQQPIVERGERGEERRAAIARKMFPGRDKLTEKQEKQFQFERWGAGTDEEDLAEVGKREEAARRAALFASLTEAERVALRDETQRAVMSRDLLGGEAAMGTAHQLTPGGIGVGTATALGLVKKGDAPELIRLQAEAIRKAMEKGFENVKFEFTNPAHNVPPPRVRPKKKAHR